ncbi:tyrosine recombinase XerC [Bacillota bacterium]
MNDIKNMSEHYLKYCVYQKGLSENSIRNYRLDLIAFTRFLENNGYPLDTGRITKAILEDYLAFLSERYKVKTIKRKLVCVQSLYTYLDDQEIIDENPFRRFKVRLKEGYRKPKSMTMNEMNQFLKSAYDSELADKVPLLIKEIEKSCTHFIDSMPLEFTWCRDVCILELLFATGLRVAELCGLKFEDYSRGDNSFHVIGKGNKERFVYLETRQAQKMFSDYLVLRKAIDIYTPYIFITKLRSPLNTQGVRNIVTKFTKLSGINKNITPHVFRHSFATLLIESGVDIKYIQDFLGHSTITTTQIYLHISDEQKKRILQSKHPRDRMCAY